MLGKFEQGTNKEALLKQYDGMKNYQYRKVDALQQWHIEQYTDSYALQNFHNVLEIGCGDGSFWKGMEGRLDFPSNVVITDFSPVMLAECQQNLSTVKIKASYQTADIDDLPFSNGTFNAVVAHKVIYHAQAPENAIKKIEQVLKPGGLFGMSVLSSGVNGSVWKLAHSIDESIPESSFTARFNNIQADEVLPKIFRTVERRNYSSTLKIPSSDTVIKALRTAPGVDFSKVSDNFFAFFKEKVDEEIAAKGCFETEYNANLYLCQK